MGAIDDLENLPLSHLFSGPLVAAIDASIQAQSEKVDLLLETGFDEDGEMITVAFDYTTTEIDPETGEEHRVRKALDVPLLLFLTLPNLVVSQIEESFSARITQVEKPDRSSSPDRLPTPLRLNITPSSQSTTFDRKTKSAFDLDIRMVAELENKSTGMETLERAANSAMFETTRERRVERLAEEDVGRRITPERNRSLRSFTEESE